MITRRQWCSRIRRALTTATTAGILITLVACSSSDDDNNGATTGSGDGQTPSDGTPNMPGDDPLVDEGLVFGPALFDASSALIDNRYLPLKAGTTAILRGFDDEGTEIDVITTVSHETRTIAGVESAIVVDREYEDGELVEETFDWFAQDILGNVWYLGEASTEYEDGVAVGTEGSWETGADVDGIGVLGRGSILMFSEPVVGQTYDQEIYPGVAEDRAEIVSLDAQVTLADGSTATALQVLETDPLNDGSDGEFKYYVSGIGLVIEEKLDGSERLDLVDRFDQAAPEIDPANFSNSTQIDHPFHPLVPGTVRAYSVETDEGREDILVEVLFETRMVMGIENVVVRDRVTLDGVLIEDTYDWFAQDNDGNVWYFGEDVVNYEYDDEGVLLGTDNDGAWESGIEGAQPGIQMPSELRVGDSYRQEYLEGEAEDLAAIVSLAETITLADGSVYTTLKTREWNPLEVDSDEYKYYAEGIGLVREEDADGEEQVDLVQPVQ